jgi:hypothetical protein
MQKLNYTKFEKLLGTDWPKLKRIELTAEGFDIVYFLNKGGNTFSLGTYYDYKGTGLPCPIIVFEANPDDKIVKALSKEDYFAHQGDYPQRDYKEVYSKGEKADTRIEKELDQYLSEWLQMLIDNNFKSEA